MGLTPFEEGRYYHVFNRGTEPRLKIRHSSAELVEMQISDIMDKHSSEIKLQ